MSCPLVGAARALPRRASPIGGQLFQPRGAAPGLPFSLAASRNASIASPLRYGEILITGLFAFASSFGHAACSVFARSTGAGGGSFRNCVAELSLLAELALVGSVVALGHPGEEAPVPAVLDAAPTEHCEQVPSTVFSGSGTFLRAGSFSVSAPTGHAERTGRRRCRFCPRRRECRRREPRRRRTRGRCSRRRRFPAPRGTS